MLEDPRLAGMTEAEIVVSPNSNDVCVFQDRNGLINLFATIENVRQNPNSHQFVSK